MTAGQTKLLSLNQEFISIVAEARSVEAITRAGGNPSTGGAVGLLFNPSELYGAAVAAMHTKVTPGAPDTARAMQDDIARGIRMTAAKIKAGDRTYVIESLVGQATWLQVMALRLSDHAATLQMTDNRVMMGGLIVKMQALAVRALANLAGMSCLEPRQPSE